jgi:hypothetical protein
VIIKQKLNDPPAISETYKIEEGEMKVRKPNDCKICHSHAHTSGICPLHTIRTGWNLDLGEIGKPEENRSWATGMIGNLF